MGLIASARPIEKFVREQQIATNAHASITKTALAELSNTYDLDLKNAKNDPEAVTAFVPSRGYRRADLTRQQVSPPRFESLDGFGAMLYAESDMTGAAPPRMLIITGRLGTGINYTTAHLLHVLLKRRWRSVASGILHGPLITFLTPTAIDDYCAKRRPLGEFLAEQWRNAGIDVRAPEVAEWLGEAWIVVDLTAVRTPDEAVKRLLSDLGRRATLVVPTEEDNYESLPIEAYFYRHVDVVELGEYPANDSTAEHLAAIMASQVVGGIPIAAHDLCATRVAKEAVRANWNLGRAYVQLCMTPPGIAPRSDSTAVRLVGEAMMAIVRSYAGTAVEWANQQWGRTALSEEVLLPKLIQAVDSVAVFGQVGGREGNAWVERLLTSEPRLSSLPPRAIGAIASKIKAVPMFRTDAETGQMSWAFYDSTGARCWLTQRGLTLGMGPHSSGHALTRLRPDASSR